MADVIYNNEYHGARASTEPLTGTGTGNDVSTITQVESLSLHFPTPSGLDRPKSI